MCGLAGVISPRPVTAAAVRRMIDPIAHRGPDDQGVWIDERERVGLGHRRLAIVDLSPLGHQPMISHDGRFVLVFNGEIYNHKALRKDLESSAGARAWRGHSDTETLLECIAAWGLSEALRHSVGMFALALWDRRERKLLLARDRFGEKPLYYGWVGGDFLFGSELKALRGHSGFDNAIDRTALRSFASRGYVPAPLSIYRDIYKLQPGCILTVDDRIAQRVPGKAPQVGAGGEGLAIAAYWSYRDTVAAGLRDPIADEGEALERLEHILGEAIRGQSMADVPVGAFLSGGIDSSAVVALYQKYSVTPVRSFSIGFAEAGFNEAEYARAVAEHLGTVHHEHYVTVDEARGVIPLLPAMYDEPFADSSQIPTFLVSRFAREQVTVALSGDGGDELFAGYNRHFAAPQLWQRLQAVPRPLRWLAGATLGQLPANWWDKGADLAGRRSQPNIGTKLQKALRVGGTARAFDDVYAGFIDEWALEASPVIGGGSGTDDLRRALEALPGASDAERTMYCDAMTYLPDDILCKVDRAAMAVSLETRVPFLDHRVAELAARIPLSMKVRGGKGKHILRKLLYREAPACLFDRPKAGFAIPVGEWLRGPLRPWAEDLLCRDRLNNDGFFDVDIVHGRWKQHLSRQRDSTPAIWAILMFQAWQDAQT